MRKLKFVTNNFYHIYNRGVEKRNIFLDEKDYYRFVYSFPEFNNVNQTSNLIKRFENHRNHIPNQKSLHSTSTDLKEPLVDILVFCLMPNHFHMMLRQLVEGGISKFLHKLGTGYTNYFNQRYKRVGRLFQSTFKATFIDTDEYLIHLSRYIHLNPLKIIQHDWKEQGIRNRKKMEVFLENYRWSSYPYYTNNFNFVSYVNKKIILEYFKDTIDYKRFVRSWAIKDMGHIKKGIEA